MIEYGLVKVHGFGGGGSPPPPPRRSDAEVAAEAAAARRRQASARGRGSTILGGFESGASQGKTLLGG